MPMTLLRHDVVGHTDEATKELRKWFPDLKVTPKPTRLIRHLIRLAGVQQGERILDCFAGTGTTAEAVINANEEDKVGATFVLIQLPEALKESPKRTMAAIARERAVRRIKQLPKSKTSGLRSFSLETSSFVRPSTEVPSNATVLTDQLRLLVDNVRKDRTSDDLLFEIILRAGFSLTSPTVSIKLGGQPVFSVADGMLLICLERKIKLECLRAAMDLKPERIVCLDIAFDGNDQLKTNTVLEMRSHGIEFRTI
jgi:adenine-specific DNA-methyltransferase